MNLHVLPPFSLFPTFARFRRWTGMTALWLLCCSLTFSCLAQTIDSRPVRVLVGYQAWFRCPGDGAPANSWSHWSKGQPTPSTMAVDLYPDTSELNPKSLCPLKGVTAGGKQAYLFSSYPKETTETHFQWMQNYGIDGALVQRFLSSIAGQQKEGEPILKNVRAAAEDHDRVFAVEYDMSGGHEETVLKQLQDDWKHLSEEEKLTSSKNYLKINGKFVVALWGFGFNDGHHPSNPKIALDIIHWFQNEAHVVVMGGVPGGWGTLSKDSIADPAWAQVYASLDIVQPWTVGRYRPASLDAWKTSHLIPDIALAKRNHQMYMPVIFPGFSWHNLNPKDPENAIPRLGGQFLWRQAYNAKTAGATFVKIAMFDEVNEGTAIFKAVSSRSDAPSEGYWLTLDADGKKLPTDWYLQIAQEIGRMFKDETKPKPDLPIQPHASLK